MQIVEFYSWVTDPFYHLFFNLLSENTFTNSSRYANKQVDWLILRGLYEPTQGKRESMSREAQKLDHRRRAVGVAVRARLLRAGRGEPAGLPALARPEPALLLEPPVLSRA